MVPKKDNVISGCINRDIPSRRMAVTVLFNSALVRLFKSGLGKLDPT